MKILVTGAGALLGQGIIKSLQKANLYDLHIISVDPNPMSAALYWVDESYLIPYATDPNYIDYLISLVRRCKPDIIIPGTDVELLLLSTHKDKIESQFNTKILVSDVDAINIANDKFKTFEFFRNSGFTPPESCLPGEELNLLNKVAFPLIVKPRVGARSVGVIKVSNIKELEQAKMVTDNPVIQEYIPGDEYTAGVIYFDGQCSASIVMRRELRDGNTYRAFVDKNPLINDQIVEFANHLKPFGPANFQFRISGNTVRVFEINCRFSGTTPLRMHAGFNEVEMCVRRLFYGEQVVQPEIKSMTILRHWSETIVLPETRNPVSI